MNRKRLLEILFIVAIVLLAIALYTAMRKDDSVPVSEGVEEPQEPISEQAGE